jgi:hypothetical protein
MQRGITRLPWFLYPQIPRRLHPECSMYSDCYILPAHLPCKSMDYFDGVKGFN